MGGLPTDKVKTRGFREDVRRPLFLSQLKSCPLKSVPSKASPQNGRPILPQKCKHRQTHAATLSKCERADGKGTRPKFAKARVRARPATAPAIPGAASHAHRCCPRRQLLCRHTHHTYYAAALASVSRAASLATAASASACNGLCTAHAPLTRMLDSRSPSACSPLSFASSLV